MEEKKPHVYSTEFAPAAPAYRAYRLGFFRGLFLGFLSAVLVAAFIDVVFVR